MICYSVGKLPVPTPGTPVRLPACSLTSDGRVARIDWTAPTSMSGASVTIGMFGTMVKTTGVGVLKELMKPSASAFSDAYVTPEQAEGNSLNPLDFAVDAATATDGPYVTYWVN